jgi:hypothetical protein
VLDHQHHLQGVERFREAALDVIMRRVCVVAKFIGIRAVQVFGGWDGLC